jgi:hypothetical protein
MLSEEDADLTSYLSSQENFLNQAKIIPGAQKGDTTFTNGKSINKIFEKHFTTHFSTMKNDTHQRDRNHLSNFLKDLPQISVEDRDSLEQPTSPEDIIIALKAYCSKNDTSPGLDGIPSLCFTSPITQHAWSSLLSGLCNAIATTGKIPASLGKFAIRLINKPGKSRLSPSGYRPISLLPIAFRIISLAWTNKLMAPFNKVIGSHQFAYLSNRRMDHGICLLASAIQRSALNPDSKTGFLSVDFKGAFDSVHHNFLRKVLSAFGLGPNACNLLLALASNLKGTVITNDLLSAFFDIEKGLPQGSSLSALLFIISLEPLLRSSSRLSTSCDGVDFGIHLSAIIRYICFADDLTIPFNSLSQLDGWLLCLKRFSSFSGLCVNWEKSVIYLLGGSFWTSSPSGIITPSTSGQIFANAITSSFPLLPPSCIKIAGDFKYCGITFSITDLMGKDRSLTASCWATRIKAMGARASILKHKIHLLSFQHRANVALSRCLSTILFLAQTSVCPEKYLREAQQHMNYLVYKCRAPPALLRIVSLPPNHGGQTWSCQC